MKRVLIVAPDELSKILIREELGDSFEIVFVESIADEKIESGEIRIELATQQAYHGADPIDLTSIELRLLSHFIRNPNRDFTRDELLTSVWGENVYVLGRTIDRHICSLRKKLGKSGKQIQTIDGIGYRFITRLREPSKAA